MHCCSPRRGKRFRKEFNRLGDVRSLIPLSTTVVALTATASIETRQKVIKILGMTNPSVHAISPHKSNITYWVADRKAPDICLSRVVQQLKEQRCGLPRIIIYCSKYEDCCMLYRFFKVSLGDQFTALWKNTVIQYSITRVFIRYTHVIH